MANLQLIFSQLKPEIQQLISPQRALENPALGLASGIVPMFSLDLDFFSYWQEDLSLPENTELVAILQQINALDDEETIWLMLAQLKDIANAKGKIINPGTQPLAWESPVILDADLSNGPGHVQPMLVLMEKIYSDLNLEKPRRLTLVSSNYTHTCQQLWLEKLRLCLTRLYKHREPFISEDIVSFMSTLEAREQAKPQIAFSICHPDPSSLAVMPLGSITITKSGLFSGPSFATVKLASSPTTLSRIKLQENIAPFFEETPLEHQRIDKIIFSNINVLWGGFQEHLLLAFASKFTDINIVLGSENIPFYLFKAQKLQEAIQLQDPSLIKTAIKSIPQLPATTSLNAMLDPRTLVVAEGRSTLESCFNARGIPFSLFDNMVSDPECGPLVTFLLRHLASNDSSVIECRDLLVELQQLLIQQREIVSQFKVETTFEYFELKDLNFTDMDPSLLHQYIKNLQRLTQLLEDTNLLKLQQALFAIGKKIVAANGSLITASQLLRLRSANPGAPLLAAFSEELHTDTTLSPPVTAATPNPLSYSY